MLCAFMHSKAHMKISVNYHNWCLWKQTMQLPVERRNQFHPRYKVIQSFSLRRT